jgi:DNA invertase Pin-like site-specific DNA recombinase
MADSDEFTSRMLQAINGMLLDMLAAVARKDYEDRRRCQAEGIRKAKGEGKFKGRQENVVKNRAIARALKAGTSWSDIQVLTGCGRATIARVAAKQKAA